MLVQAIMNKMTLSIVGFLFLATIVSAYPSLPYTDLKNEQKDVQLSEEAVAAYLKDKMDKENLEPASIMKYVVALLEGSSKKTTKDEDGKYACMCSIPTLHSVTSKSQTS